MPGVNSLVSRPHIPVRRYLNDLDEVRDFGEGLFWLDEVVVKTSTLVWSQAHDSWFYLRRTFLVKLIWQAESMRIIEDVTSCPLRGARKVKLCCSPLIALCTILSNTKWVMVWRECEGGWGRGLESPTPPWEKPPWRNHKHKVALMVNWLKRRPGAGFTKVWWWNRTKGGGGRWLTPCGWRATSWYLLYLFL